MKYFARFILWIIGWDINIVIPKDNKKFVCAIAPHTSNLDFFLGKLGFWAQGATPKFMIKKEAFNFFTGRILRALGGVPVDRRRKTNIVDQMVEQFEKHDVFMLTITPEGTRKRTRNWKKGFYSIAMKANVPIYFGYLDYGKKVGGMHDVFHVTGDYEKDIKVYKEYYRGMQGKNKEMFTID